MKEVDESSLLVDTKIRRKSLFHATKTLNRETVEERLEFLAPSVNNKLVFVELDLSGLKLTNIDVLAGYVHLQVLKLAHNSLTHLSVLGNLPNLIYLDVPFNRNSKLFDFTAPSNLQEANYNHNVISAIPVLANFWTLTKLQLEHNNIRRISYGLLFCKRLTYLSMSGNGIKTIDNLRNLPLRILLLSNNDITDITNLETLVYLEILDLSRNSINKLTGLEGHYYLNSLDVSENQIKSLSELSILEKLPALRNLNLAENPICDNRMYKNILLATQPSILVLDGRLLTVTEKVRAISHIHPQRDIVSIRDRFINSVYSFLQPLKVRPSTTDQRFSLYPLLILLGPLGSLKSPLLVRVVKDFPEFWKRAISYSTRPTQKHELKNYRHVSVRQFELLQQSGEFVQTTFLYGEHYGLAWDTIDNIAKMGRYPIANMELEAILTLKLTHFRLYLILVMPLDANIHRTRLEAVIGANESVVQEAMDRRKLYLDYYNIDPALFSIFINTDNPETAYNQLKEVVVNIQNQIIAEKNENLNSTVQWNTSQSVDRNNKLDIESMEYRHVRMSEAFIHNRAGILFPKSSKLEVTLDPEFDQISIPKSEFST